MSLSPDLVGASLPLPAKSRSPARPASLGMRVFVAADAVTFAALIAAALLARGDGWRAPGDPGLSPVIGGLLTAALIASSAALAIGGRRRWGRAVAAAFGLAFVAGALWEWQSLAASGLALGNSRFADAFFVITAYHLAHVAAGVVALAITAARSPRGPGADVALAWYWHFVDVIWLAIAATFYL